MRRDEQRFFDMGYTESEAITLAGDERRRMMARVREHMTAQDIACRMGVTRARVYQLLRKAECGGRAAPGIQNPREIRTEGEARKFRRAFRMSMVKVEPIT